MSQQPDRPLWRSLGDDLLLATVFLTRLPLRLPEAAQARPLAGALWLAPLIGLAIGLAIGLVYWLALNLGLPRLPAAGLALAAGLLLTGALHEDGLADVADGFGGGADKARKLEILRDSRLGSYGALALGLSLLIRVGALATLDAGGAMAALAVIHAVSRAGLPAMMAALAPARADGLGAGAGSGPAWGPWAAAGIAFVAGVFPVGFAAGLLALLAAGLALAALGFLARRQIGGYTGDVLGAGQQVAEIAALLALVAVID